MTDYKKVRILTETKLKKAIAHLQFSFDKAQKILSKTQALVSDDLSEEELETLESFASRFSRVTDIFLSRYLRVRVYELDPAFRGTLRDQLNYCEKASIISETDHWFAIRELRNKISHEYDDDEILLFYKSLMAESGFVFSELNKIL